MIQWFSLNPLIHSKFYFINLPLSPYCKFCQAPLQTCRPDPTLVGRSRGWLCFPPVTRRTRRTRTRIRTITSPRRISHRSYQSKAWSLFLYLSEEFFFYIIRKLFCMALFWATAFDFWVPPSWPKMFLNPKKDLKLT